MIASNNKVWQSVLSVLTALYLLLIIVSMCPPSPWQTRVMESVGSFLYFWKLEQNWALFSPTIRAMNYHTTSTLTFEDGTSMVIELPRMSKLDLLQKFRAEKWRKWASDRVPWDDYADLRPDLARYLGRTYYNPSNKPVSMCLNLWTASLPDIRQPIGQLHLPPQTICSCVFTYRFSPEDFR